MSAATLAREDRAHAMRARRDPPYPPPLTATWRRRRRCVTMHASVRVKSHKYREEMRRHNYVTPTSYLELISMIRRADCQLISD